VSDTASPLEGPPPTEVPLKNAPLIRVIAQVRFPVIASIENREFVGSFQEAIRGEYPVLRPEKAQALILGPDGPVAIRPSTVWRFSETRGPWRVSLSPEFIALEAVTYSSREDFLSRLERVLEALRRNIDPKVADRIGVRYIDRVTGANLISLPSLIRSEVASVIGTEFSSHAQLAITESLFTLPDGAGELKGRWGLLPANATVDPAAIDPIGEPSWILDLDAFMAQTRDFDVAALVTQARSFAERIYSFFRWAVTREFLTRYGGDV